MTTCSKFECALIMFRATVATVVFLILPVYMLYMTLLILHDREKRVIEMCGVWFRIECDDHDMEIFMKYFREHLIAHT